MLLTGPAARRLSIPAGSMLLYSMGRVSITGAVSPNEIEADTYQYFILNTMLASFRFQEFQTSRTDPDVGPGTLYYDGVRALFVNNDVISNTINGLDLPAVVVPMTPPPPLSQVSVSYIRRGTQLVLNLNDEPDMTTTSANDVIELTGMTTRTVSSDQSVSYSGDTVTLRQGSTVRGTFPSTQLVVLSDLRRGNDVGRSLRRFMGSSSEAFFGPGTLYMGMLGGQTVAFYSTSSVNNDIIGNVVSQQVTFTSQSQTNMAQVTDIFTNPGTTTSLIELSGSRTFSFSTASRVLFNNGIVTIQDRFGQQLGRFSGVSLNGFINSRIVSYGTMGDETITIPEGGLNMITNGGQAFIYPAGNSVITSGISTALSQITVPIPVSIRYDTTSQSDGTAFLMGNGITLVTISSGRTIDLNPTQSIAYDGSTGTLTVFNIANPSTPIASFTITSFSVSESPTSLTTYSSSVPLNRDISGPGRLYVDNQNRAFFTSEQRLQDFITGFINSLPPARISTVTRTINQTQVVNLENGGRRLVEVSSSSMRPTTDQSSIVYFGNTVYVAQGFVVPGSSSVMYNPTTGMTTITSTDGTTVSYPTSMFTLQRFPADTTNVITTNMTFSGGGFFYRSPMGDVRYILFENVDMMFIDSLRGIGIINDANTIPNVNEFNFFNGRRIVTFTGSSSNVFSGPGSSFTAGGQTFYSTSMALNARIANEVAQVLPSSIVYNSTTGTITITSGTGSAVTSFTVSTTSSGSVSPTSSFTFSNGVLVAPTVFSSNITGVTSFVIFNGFETTTFGPGDSFTLMGPGTLIYDRNSGQVTFTTDSTTSSRLMQRIQGVMNTFTAPVLSRPGTQEQRSKFRNVNSTFGQVGDCSNDIQECLICSYNQLFMQA